MPQIQPPNPVGTQLTTYDSDPNQSPVDFQKIVHTALSSAIVQGPQTAPVLPGTTTPFVNPFTFACLVTISGGSVSAISVDGAPLGITAGTIILLVGASVSLTYVLAPTWSWYGLS